MFSASRGRESNDRPKRRFMIFRLLFSQRILDAQTSAGLGFRLRGSRGRQVRGT